MCVKDVTVVLKVFGLCIDNMVYGGPCPRVVVLWVCIEVLV